MRLLLIAALCAATSTMSRAEVVDFDEWFVTSDGKKCILTYEDEAQMIDIVTDKGGVARFATDPSTTGDLFQSFDGEVILAGKSQGLRQGQTAILSTKIGTGYVMKFEPQMLVNSGEQGTGEIRRNGKVIFRFPMKGAAAAARALMACQAKIPG